MTSQIDRIPSLDLNDFLKGNKEEKEKFAKDLGTAYQEIGFVSIKNHGFSEELQEKMFAASKLFFALPDEVKLKYDGAITGGQRGYTGKRKETAAGFDLPDLKEFYHVGKHIEGKNDPAYMANIWPIEVPEFEREALKVYRQLESVGKTMLRAISLFLELEEGYFENKVDEGISILRPLHYYPITNTKGLEDGAVRAAEHGDINLITVLMGASADGLQVKRRDDKWIPITGIKDELVVNVGDMLERLTNGRLRSTIHRVVNPNDENLASSRYSIPFFMHANPKMKLNCLENCIDSEHPKQFEDITAAEFLHERLVELGLIK